MVKNVVITRTDRHTAAYSPRKKSLTSFFESAFKAVSRKIFNFFLDLRNPTGYNMPMIKSFAHKGLETLFNTGVAKGVQAKHANKLILVLDLLNAADHVEQMAFPGANLHPLKHDLKGHWAVKVSGNWRLTFRFEDGHAYVVDYQDYH